MNTHLVELYHPNFNYLYFQFDEGQFISKGKKYAQEIKKKLSPKVCKDSVDKLTNLGWPKNNPANDTHITTEFVDKLITVFNDIQTAQDACPVKKPAEVIPLEQPSVTFIVIGVIIGLLVVLLLGGYAFFTVRNRRRVTQTEEVAVNRNVYTVMDYSAENQ